MLKRRFSSWILPAASLALFLGAGPAAAQEEPIEVPEPDVERTVLKKLRYVNPADVVELLEVLPVRAAVQESLDVLVLRGSEEGIDTALKMLDALDVPPEPGRDLELKLYLVSASKDGPESVPARLEKALASLADIVGPSNFELVDTVFLRATVQSRAQTQVPLASGDLLTLRFDRAIVLPGEPGEARIVHLDGFSFRVGNPSFGVETDVEVREGQMAVIGKSTGQSRDQARIVVLEIDVLAEGGGG